MYKAICILFFAAILTFLIEPAGALPQEHNITLSIELAINGSEQGEANADLKYACLEDSSVNDKPAFGVVFAGQIFRNVLYAPPRTIELGQASAGNKFLVPITRSGCGTIREKISKLNEILSDPYIGFINQKYLANLILFYPSVDIVGTFSRRGRFSLNLEKGGTEDLQIIITPK